MRKNRTAPMRVYAGDLRRLGRVTLALLRKDGQAAPRERLRRLSNADRVRLLIVAAERCARRAG